MSKKITALILCMILLFAPSSALAAGGGTAISTPEELSAIADDPGGNYYLDADLDMTGVDWAPIAFSGTLDGRGHGIYNLRVTRLGDVTARTVDGNNKPYDTVFAGLFSALNGGTVRNLTLQGVDIEIESAQHCFIGGIAGYIYNATVSSVRVLDARLTLTAACQPEATDPRTSCNAGVGGIAGFGVGTVENCEADVTLVFIDKCAASLRCEQFMGGVLSCGNVKITDTQVKLRGYDECRGYAHNGGFVGMFYVFNPGETARPISRCGIDGAITFFEDNYDRRAYCEAFVGEMLTWTSVTDVTVNFQRNEVFDYSAVLRPEKCAVPTLTETVHTADCHDVGYTEHTCTVCGNTWRDSFVPQAHVPGEWIVSTPATYTESGVRVQLCSLCGKTLREEVIAPHVDGEWVTAVEPGYGQPGLMQLLCADCGAVLAEEPTPALIGADRVTISPAALEMDYKSTAVISWTLEPAEVYQPMVYFTSSDERVVTVEANGTVHAVGRGTAVVTCTSADGFAKAECTVTVKLTVWQWIREYILFGWVLKH